MSDRDRDDMPAELLDLERELAAASAADGPPAPSGDLRPRVLRAVQAELRADQTRRRLWWAAGAAAAVLIWANLSLTLTTGAGAGIGAGAGAGLCPPDPSGTRQLAAEIRREFPDLAPREAFAHAAEIRVAARLVPRPAVAGRFSAPAVPTE